MQGNTPHAQECADRIRTIRLYDAGDPALPDAYLVHEIAAAISACCGHHPVKALRLARGWSIPEALGCLAVVCERDGLHVHGATKRAWIAWEAGNAPGRELQDALGRLFQSNPVRLGFARDYSPPGACNRSHRQDGGETERDQLRGQVMSAAHESSEHAAMAESSAVGGNALEQLSMDIVTTARAYPTASLPPLFADLIRIRDRCYALLDRTRVPAQESELYLLAGQSCGLLASASFDLGQSRAAAENARAARAYGEIIGHDELRAWADGTLATIEFWAGHPSNALRLVTRGLDRAVAGTSRVRLSGIKARAAALMGDAEQVRAAVDEAAAAREAGRQQTMHDEIGGEFAFPEAREAFCFATAYLELEDTRSAITACRRSIELYARAEQPERWIAAEAGARSDLASAYLREGDVEAAAEALGDVFAMPADQRAEGLLRRLARTRSQLTQGDLTRSRPARELGERIEAFSSSGTPALP